MARHDPAPLWALAAGELDAAERARVEAHVAECAECAARLAQVKQSRAVLHEAREAPVGVRWAEVDAELREAAARAMKQPRTWRTHVLNPVAPGARLPWALALAGVCAVLLGVWRVRTPEVAPGAVVAGGAVGTVREGDGARSSPQPRITEAVHTESTSGAMVREAGGAERALQAGTRLRSGVAVRTPARSTALLRLPDESRVRLSAGSEVELSRAEAKAVHLTVRQGRLSVQASHAEREAFLVEAEGLRVSVVGTVFTVERTEHGAAVAVAEGRVRVEAEGQAPRLVSAGERVELNTEEKTLKPQPVSEPDRRAFEELSPPAPGNTVATEAVAQAAQAPAPKKPVVATREARAPVPTVAPSTGGTAVAPKEQSAPSEAAPAPAQAVAEAVPVVPPEAEPDQEFAPYPAKSVTEQLPPKTAQAPTPVAEAPVRGKDKKEGLIPMALMSRDADERFLGYARLQMSARTCESYLVGLEEIAQRSPSRAHREQARYLRARCFEEKLQPQAAQSEYRQYLDDFPRGRYVREAKTALLP